MASYANSMVNLHSGGTPTASQTFGLMGTSIKLASRSELSLNCGGGGSGSLSVSRNSLSASKSNLSGGTRAGSTYKLSTSSNPRLASSSSIRSPPGSRPKSPSSHRTPQAPITGNDTHASRSTLLIDGLDPHHVVSATHSSSPAATAPSIVLPPKQAWGDQASRYHLVSAVLPNSHHHHHAPNASSSHADLLAAHTHTHPHAHAHAQSAAMTIPTPPQSPSWPASPATDDAMSVASSSSSSDEYSPRKGARGNPTSRNPQRRGGNASVNASGERFYDWKHLKQQTHRRNTENWAMESIVVRRLRYLVDHIDELDGKHLGLLAALEESGVTNAQLQQYFPYVTSIHDLKLHLTTLLMDRQHRQRGGHPHSSHSSDHSSPSESSLALSAKQLAPAIPGAPTPRTLNRATPAAPRPTYPRGAPTVARRAYGHKQPLVTPVEVLKIVEQFNPVSLAVQDAMSAGLASRAAAAAAAENKYRVPVVAQPVAGSGEAVRASIKTLERTQVQVQGGGGGRAGEVRMSRTRSRNEAGMSVGGGGGGAGYVK